jgi:hypothetical protein
MGAQVVRVEFAIPEDWDADSWLDELLQSYHDMNQDDSAQVEARQIR